MKHDRRISLHGGHSGDFCSHAKDRLEDIVCRYIELGFPSVGITEHAPPETDDFLYPDEKDLGLTASALLDRFERYMKTVKALKEKYAGKITIYAGMETETCGDYVRHINNLIETFQPDYIVGSVHHVNDICFDYSAEIYAGLANDMGSVENLYTAYFDLQYEMIHKIKPFVVGHLDLIRIYDEAYEDRLKHPDILPRIKRNLELIKSLGLVLDFNLRSLSKGGKEPYISRPLLEMARDMKIPVAPGDDSHGAEEAGKNVDMAVETLEALGFDTRWPIPVIIK